jgi:hypothetical protein
MIHCEDPAKHNWLASPLVREPNYYCSQAMSSNSRQTKSWHPWGQVFYASDPDVICLAWHNCTQITGYWSARWEACRLSGFTQKDMSSNPRQDRTWCAIPRGGRPCNFHNFCENAPSKGGRNAYGFSVGHSGKDEHTRGRPVVAS